MTLREDLLTYWPTDAQVRACIMADAEGADNAVLLAVHQPMRFERRTIGADAPATSCNEEELLRAFLTPSPMDGRVILPIVGTSGTGKSHVIKWLDARLQQAPGFDRRVVIRIPKGTSLKEILDLLLRKLTSATYEKYREELKKAQQSLDTKEAAGLLCETLAHIVSEMGEAAKVLLTRNPRDAKAQEKWAFCSPEMLPALLRNQFLRDHHFVSKPSNGEGVVSRLVEQLTVSKGGHQTDDRRHVFVPQDLIFDDAIDASHLGRDEQRAIAQLDRANRREIACGILNSALDGAKQRLLKLDPTISDLFDSVRKELLKEGRELVLLVEDFADLSGIQKQLLQVVIREAYRDGRQVLCTMRTAMAYTTGYITAETVLTRAHHEYHIPDAAGSEEEMLDRIERLVGAYLNAARVGQPTLRREYDRAGNSSLESHLSAAWIPRFAHALEDDAQATLHAFGVSVDNYELFPFNSAAIRELSREGSTKGGRLVYNPRFVIQSVLYRVLNERGLFEKGQFPSETFASANKPLPARVSEELRRRVPGLLERYLSFYTYWGDFPASIEEAAGVDQKLLAAFGLPSIDYSGIPTSRPPDGLRGRGVPLPETRVPAPISSIESEWEQRLEQWRGGEALAQAKANELRKITAEALHGASDFDWYNHRPLPDDGIASWFRWIYIPRAGGNEGRTFESSMVALCNEEDLSDRVRSAEIHTQLMALIRYHRVHKGSWDYAGADTDLPAYSALLQRLTPRAQAFVRSRYFRIALDPIPALVDGLLIGARALGVPAAASDTDYASLIASLFSPAPATTAATPPSPEFDSWFAFSNALRQCRKHEEASQQLSWTNHLLNLTGARQGQADRVHAVDLTVVKESIDSTRASWEFLASQPPQVGADVYSVFRSNYAELKKLSQAVEPMRKRFLEWHAATSRWLGNDDKEEAIRDIKELLDEIRAAGLGTNVDIVGALQLAETLRTSRLAPALEDGRRLLSDASRGTALVVLGNGHFPVMAITDRLRSTTDAILTYVTAKVDGEARTYGPDPLGEAITLLIKEVTETAKLLQRISPS
ncbi:MAG TPA: protein DpdH [Gemmatimonadaceae bacterium]|nr:protein DpdH [Gemmatimonadaceae bacterium]